MPEKCFRDTRIQIGILRCRGMIIKNKSFAKRVIRETNYYNLINGYKTPFILQTTPNERYLPGTRFEELYALYEFDRKLRIITLEEILKIEKRVKTLVAYCFSDNHGHRDYLRFENFDIQGADKFLQVSKLLSVYIRKLTLIKKMQLFRIMLMEKIMYRCGYWLTQSPWETLVSFIQICCQLREQVLLRE